MEKTLMTPDETNGASAAARALDEQAHRDMQRAKSDGVPCTGIGFDPETGTIVIAGRGALALHPVGIRLTVLQAIQLAVHTLQVVAQGVQAGEALARNVATQEPGVTGKES